MMKKVNILTVSMIAILAVTNARADIASTTYVDGKIQPVSSALSTHTGNTDIHVTAEQKTAWSGKQDAISDLETIRSGAALGATALQSVPDASPTVKGIMTKAEAYNANLTADEKKATAASVYVAERAAQAAASAAVTSAAGTYQNASDSNVATAGTYIETGNNVASNLAKLDTAVKANADAIATKAAQSDLTTHTGNTTVHITANERTAWNNAATTASTALQQSNVAQTYSATGTAPVSGAAVKDAIDGLNLGTTYQTAANSNVTGTTNYLTAGNGVAANLKALDTKVKENADAVAGKQAIISDLETIRTGAGKGATAVQPGDIAQTYDATSSAAMSGKAIASAISTAGGNYATAAQGELADTALQKADIASGSANGTISVDGDDVSVKGLKSAAYTESSAYATAAQGALADSALQQSNVAQTYSATGTAPVSGAAVKAAIDGLNLGTTYQTAANSNVTGTTNYLTAGNGVATNLKALDTKVKENADAIATKAAQSDLTTHTGNTTVHITANERTAWNNAATAAAAALPAATYNTQVGTVSAANMGTTATTVVGAIKEVHDSVAGLNSTYATDSELSTGLDTKQNKSSGVSVGGANGAWNTLANGNGITITTNNGTTTIATAGNYVTVPSASGSTGKSVLTYDSEANSGAGMYYWENIGR